MRWLDRCRMSWSSLFSRGRETERLKQELQFHLDQQVKENVAAGASPAEARAAALRTFGNVTSLQEEARAQWSWQWLEKFFRDLHYAARALVRSPGFSVTAILVMALGLGAATSLFTIVRAVLLKPLPFRDPEGLVMVYEHFNTTTNGDGFNFVSPADFIDWRQQTHGFADMAAWLHNGFDLTGDHGELPEVVHAAGGTYNLFSVLGTQVALGRTFTREEDQPGGDRVALLTWNLFQRRFAGDASIVGKHIRLDAEPYQVVGVLPPSFSYPDADTQLWVPYKSTLSPQMLAVHDMHQSHVVARLKPGVSAEAATRQVSALQNQIHLAHAALPVAESARWRPIMEDVVHDVRTPLVVLFCAVGCMLLIACLNVSNLLIARGAARRKELAVRGALGGSRFILIAEQMTESLLICILGGSMGILLSVLVTQWLASQWIGLPRGESIQLDSSVLVFSVGLIVFTTLLAGLLPAIASTGESVLAVLQESSRAIGGSVSRASLRKTLLTGEIALTVVLLTSAGLLFKSFLHLRAADLGCVTDNVLTLRYSLPEKQYSTPDKITAFHETIIERVRRLPGVLAAGLVSTPPGGGYEGDYVFTIPEHPAVSFSLQNDAINRTADPGYFSALQIPLIRGRFFTAQERLGRYQFIIVSQAFADKYFPAENPLGRHINVIWSGKPETYEIIGVVGDTLYSVTEPITPMMYFPLFAGLPGSASEATLVVRTAGNPLALSIPIQQQIASLDPLLPVENVLTLQQVIGKDTNSQAFSARLVLAFALLSLLLAAIGLYGVLSYLVTQRITEIGVRIALGAQRGQVMRLILLDGLTPVAAGLAIGLAGGVAAAMFIHSLLYGTSPLDPLVIVCMIATLLFTALIACLIPAIRASQVEPMQALRTE